MTQMRHLKDTERLGVLAEFEVADDMEDTFL
jgi:hypothetical protein